MNSGPLGRANSENTDSFRFDLINRKGDNHDEYRFSWIESCRDDDVDDDDDDDNDAATDAASDDEDDDDDDNDDDNDVDDVEQAKR
ncbi:hypothetical protein HZH68_014456 [Vespula germanica]|uniref:Uncharacterized protein n=1 Tax=Vespula germanica TaxID=30212 RepID=A0A834JB04_VESGE|nr:hypothetical protein HZH68_014456 [Vespula germanica]